MYQTLFPNELPAVPLRRAANWRGQPHGRLVPGRPRTEVLYYYGI